MAAATSPSSAANGLSRSPVTGCDANAMAVSVEQRLSDEQVESFGRDGFLIVEEGFVSERAIEMLREHFDALFAGEYATGIQPDEVNWRSGRDREDLTRQICNGWRADDLIAAQVLSERTGRLAAQLGGYRGTRMLQDNCLWKPPGAPLAGDAPGRLVRRLPRAAGDDHLLGGAGRDARAQGGAIEYVRGSHRWPRVRRRAAVPRPGGLARTGRAQPRRTGPPWSACRWSSRRAAARSTTRSPSTARAQRGLRPSAGARVAPVPVETRFHPTEVDLIYSRYRRRADLSLDESFFPVVWDQTGGRSAWLAELPVLP